MVTKSDLEKLKDSTDSLKFSREEEAFDNEAAKTAADLQNSKLAVSLINTIIQGAHTADKIKTSKILGKYQTTIDTYKKNFLEAKQLEQVEMLKNLSQDSDTLLSDLESELGEVESPKPKKAAMNAVKDNLAKTMSQLALVGERSARKRDNMLISRFSNETANKIFNDPLNSDLYFGELKNILNATVGEIDPVQSTQIEAAVTEAKGRGLVEDSEIDLLKDFLQKDSVKRILPQNVYRYLTKQTVGKTTSGEKKNKALAAIREAGKGRFITTIRENVENLDSQGKFLFNQVLRDYASNLDKEELSLTFTQTTKHEKLLADLPVGDRRTYRLFIKDMDKFSRDDPREFVKQLYSLPEIRDHAILGRYFSNDEGIELGRAYYKSLVKADHKNFDKALIKKYNSRTLLTRKLEMVDLYVEDAISKGELTKKQGEVVKLSVNPVFGEDVILNFPRYIEAANNFGRVLYSIPFTKWAEISEEVPDPVNVRRFLLLSAAINEEVPNDETLRDQDKGKSYKESVAREANSLVTSYKKKFEHAHPFTKRNKEGIRTLNGNIMKYDSYTAKLIDPIYGEQYVEKAFKQMSPASLRKYKHLFNEASQEIMEYDDFRVVLLDTDARGRHTFGLKIEKTGFFRTLIDDDTEPIERTQTVKLKLRDDSDFIFDIRSVVSGKGNLFDGR